MELELIRIKSESDYTIGNLYDETQKKFCNTLEDEYRKIKVMKETRIPEGKYKLGIQHTITDMTDRYLNDKRLKPWFERHIEVKDVPNFNGVYIHIGNDDEDTAGCILLGIWDGKSSMISSSVLTYKKFYLKYYPLLKGGKEIYINIKLPV
jgi:hypothetical protein